MQVDVLFFKCIDDGEELYIPNPIVAFGRHHFFQYEHNWVENELPIVGVFLRENPTGHVIGCVYFDKGFEVGVEMMQDRS